MNVRHRYLLEYSTDSEQLDPQGTACSGSVTVQGGCKAAKALMAPVQ
jgi:hypothetical protein